MAVMFFTLFVLYIVIAIFILVITRKASSLQRKLIVAFLILLPSWDAVLGAVIFLAALPIIPTDTIYETAETECIYYEGGIRNTIILFDSRYFGNYENRWGIVLDQDDFKRGYKYFESQVTGRQQSVLGNKEVLSPPVVYRCTPLPIDPSNPNFIYSQCVPAERIMSDYLVKTSKFHLASFEMNSMEIYNRHKGYLMAVYREIVWWRYFPFFVWLFVPDHNAEGVSYPWTSRLYDFQYDVLRLKYSAHSSL